MEPTDPTIEILLRDIRDGLRRMNARLDRNTIRDRIDVGPHTARVVADEQPAPMEPCLAAALDELSSAVRALDELVRTQSRTV
jgi:hypothetical protein